MHFHPRNFAPFDSQGRMWIGATNLNGPMTWVDGKPLSYTSWAGGQPASSKKICLMRLYYYIVHYDVKKDGLKQQTKI
jgi:hypothetical protein